VQINTGNLDRKSTCNSTNRYLGRNQRCFVPKQYDRNYVLLAWGITVQNTSKPNFYTDKVHYSILLVDSCLANLQSTSYVSALFVARFNYTDVRRDQRPVCYPTFVLSSFMAYEHSIRMNIKPNSIMHSILSRYVRK
jgi:hypothetical protein